METFTRDHGRVPLIARGARRSKSTLHGVLLSFQPLLLSWTGKTELRTLTRAEWEGAYAPLKGQSLLPASVPPHGNVLSADRRTFQCGDDLVGGIFRDLHERE